jgi:AraC-like DNA-binding protein
VLGGAGTVGGCRRDDGRASRWTAGIVSCLIRTDSSTIAPASVDRLTGLLDRFGVSTSLIEVGPLRLPRRYGADGAAPGGGHLHVLRAGTIEVVHPDGGPAPLRRRVDEPTLLLYAAPQRHQLVPLERVDVTCAALRFAQGPLHPLVRALPPVVAVPVAAIDGLAPALDLLTAEVEHVRCGRRLLADRLLEVVLVQLLRWLFDHPEQAGVTDGLVLGMSDPGVAAALVAVHDDPGAAWTLERLAATASMSRSAFARTFRALVGRTPAAYVADYRMAVVQQRLLEGEQLVGLAHELGYSSASGLSRAFTARTGASPTAWLARARAG